MKTQFLLRFAVLLTVFSSRRAGADALDRMAMDKLQATHDAVAALQPLRQPVEQKSPYEDFRAILHLHSKFSHDSRGTLEEVAAAATKAGVRVLMFTEHPADHYDFHLDGHQGMKDGVLLIPGAETRGFLAFARKSIKGLDFSSPQEFSDMIRRQGGLTFVSHLEERMDWDIRGVTGCEIYNTHADVKEEKRLMSAMRSPLTLLQLVPAVRKFPQEAYSALLDYPADYLRRYDQLCQKARLTGVAANDAHQNIGVVVKLLAGGKVRLEDVLEQKLAELDTNQIPLLAPLALGRKPGDKIFEIRLDPYPIAMRHVSTHLLMKEQTQPAVWDALENGRVYVSSDWLCDPTGFVCWVDDASGRHEMGSRFPFAANATLSAAAPAPARWRIIQDGKEIHSVEDRKVQWTLKEPGVYRLEAWLKIAGDDKFWILTNPFYIQR